MSTSMSFRFLTTGPLFNGPETKKQFARGMSFGFKQIGANGVKLVQAQLTPGHGRDQGFLQGGIHFTLQPTQRDPDQVLIDADKNARGEPRSYANWIEEGGNQSALGKQNIIPGLSHVQEWKRSIVIREPGW
tara:strand:+ start:894 stop:1289 length:396 start_codon:yes stop_codon:yes gene_type:complete